MVKQANKHLKFYLFVFYIIFTPHLCLMIYYIIFDSSNFEATQARFAIETIVILCDLFQLYCISVFSAQITLKSHEPYYTMHGVNKFKNLPDNVQLQVIHFKITQLTYNNCIFTLVDIVYATYLEYSSWTYHS